MDAILDRIDAFDARDRAPPPAPKKSKRSTSGAGDAPSPVDVWAHPLSFVPVPSALKATDSFSKQVFLSNFSTDLATLGAKHVAAGWVRAYRTQQAVGFYDDVAADSALSSDVALAEATCVEPAALSDGRFKDLVLAEIGDAPFSFGVSELSIGKKYTHGAISAVGIHVNCKEYVFALDELERPCSSPTPPKGRFEEIATGKGGMAVFWVEA